MSDQTLYCDGCGHTAEQHGSLSSDRPYCIACFEAHRGNEWNTYCDSDRGFVEGEGWDGHWAGEPGHITDDGDPHLKRYQGECRQENTRRRNQ